MGREKALLPWPPRTTGPGTILSSWIRALNLFNDLVLVVVGENQPSLQAVVYENNASLVRNPDPARGQFSSLQVGLNEVLNRGRDAATVALVDRPPPASATLETLHSAFCREVGLGRWAVIPELDGKHGHPILIGREMIEALLRAEPNSNTGKVIAPLADHITYVPVSDPFVTLEMNTPQDYVAL
jgi:CTP:molybdopterin cytidylyltransferase MocA